MAVHDETLIAILDQLRERAQAAGFTRERGGLARGIAWAELSGRHDGAWTEMRLHHNERERTLQAGLIVYQPLSRGGLTKAAGNVLAVYHLTPDEVTSEIVDACTAWIASSQYRGGRVARPRLLGGYRVCTVLDRVYPVWLAAAPDAHPSADRRKRAPGLARRPACSYSTRKRRGVPPLRRRERRGRRAQSVRPRRARGIVTPADLATTLARLRLRPAHLARLLGVERSTVSRWLDGDRGVPDYVAVALHQYEQLAELERQAAARP